jgi:hypothetical protein
MTKEFTPPMGPVIWYVVGIASNRGLSLSTIASHVDWSVKAQTWFEARRKAIVLLAQHGVLTDDPVLEMEEG